MTIANYRFADGADSGDNAGGDDVADVSMTSSTQAFYLQGHFSIPILVAQELGEAGPE